MSNRKGADLGLTLVNLGYVTPTLASLGGCKSTVGPGLPPFSGRSVGDFHRNATDSNEYVLSGVAGTTVTDAYGRANGAIGTAETGQAYTVVTAAPQILGNVVAFGTTGTGGLVNVGAGAQEVSADVVFPVSGVSDNVHLQLRCDVNGANGYDLSLENARIKIGKGGFVGSALLATINSGQRSVSGRYLFTVDASTATPTLRVYLNDVLIGSVQDSSGNNNTYAGFYGTATVANQVTLDNLRILTPGTLSWTQSLTLASLGYTAPTLTSLGGCKSTVGPGLPTVTGRSTGDFHLNQTDGKEYTLTGASAGSDSDSFNRPDTPAGGSSIGSTAGGRAWVAAGGTAAAQLPFISGNKMVQSSVNNRGSWAINIGSLVGGGSVSATMKAGASAADVNFLTLSIGVPLAGDPSDGSAIANGWYVAIETHSTTPLVNVYKPDGTTCQYSLQGLIWGAAASTYTLSISPNGLTATVYKDGVALTAPSFGNPTSASAATGTYAGFGIKVGSAPTLAGYLDDFSVFLNGTLAWTAPASGSMTYKGAWVSGAYALNDVVTDAYGLWLALAAVPTGPTYEPSLVPQYLSGGAVLASATQTPNVALGVSAYAQPFIPNANMTVSGGSIDFAAGSLATNSFRVGLTSTSPTGTGTSPAYLTVSQAITAPQGAGSMPFVFPAQALVSGTTYWLVVEQVAGNDDCELAANNTMAPALVGISSLPTVARYRPTGAGAWANDSTNNHVSKFSLSSGTASPYWRKLGNTGNQENVGQVAASGATLTIPDPEIQPVTRAVLTANLVVALPTVKSGQSFKVVLVQDATGSRTVAWTGGTTVLWPGGVAPTQTATALKGDVYEFFADGAGNWLGRVVAQNY